MEKMKLRTVGTDSLYILYGETATGKWRLDPGDYLDIIPVTLCRRKG